MGCKYCKKETDNKELLPNKKNQLILTPICDTCFKKIKVVGAL